MAKFTLLPLIKTSYVGEKTSHNHLGTNLLGRSDAVIYAVWTIPPIYAISSILTRYLYLEAVSQVNCICTSCFAVKG